MNAEILKRARWESQADRWILKARVQDGMAILATITGGRFASAGYCWQAGHIGGYHISLYGAQRAARKALREVRDA